MRFLITVVLLIVTYSHATVAASDTAPDWYRTGFDAAYSRDAYITGVGESTVLNRAISQAKASIAGQIKTDINQRTIIETGSSRMQRTQLTDSRVSQLLTNIQIVNQVRINANYYVMVALNKDHYITGLKADLTQLSQSIHDQNQTRDQQLADKKYYTALNYYTSLLPMAATYDTKRSVYDYLSDRPWKDPYPGVNRQGIQTSLTTVTSGLTWSIESGNNQAIAPAKKSNLPVVIQVSYKGVALPNQPIRVTYSDGTLLGRYQSDKSGRIKIYPYGLPVDSPTPKLTVALDLSGAARQWRGLIANQAITYTLADNQPKTTVDLNSYWDSPASEALINRLKQQFNALGIATNITSSTDKTRDNSIALRVTVTVDSHDIVPGFDKESHWINGYVRLSRADNLAYFTDITFNVTGVSREAAMATLPQVLNVPKLTIYTILNATETKKQTKKETTNRSEKDD